jgi:hypothetical protein|tara:strand:+ start:1147 stop:1650 length:504 start_codon:yes stop_codon:yes gene_type:complete
MVAFTKPTKKQIRPKPVGLFDFKGQQESFKNARRRQYDTRAPGSEKYKPVKEPNKAPSYMKATKPTTPDNIDKGSGNPYTPTQLKPVGPNMGKVNRNTKGNSVPGTAAVKKKAPVNTALISKNTPSGINRMDKKKLENKKKRFRAGPTMTSMGGMRKSGMLKGRYVK